MMTYYDVMKYVQEANILRPSWDCLVWAQASAQRGGGVGINHSWARTCALYRWPSVSQCALRDNRTLFFGPLKLKLAHLHPNRCLRGKYLFRLAVLLGEIKLGENVFQMWTIVGIQTLWSKSLPAWIWSRMLIGQCYVQWPCLQRFSPTASGRSLVNKYWLMQL